MSYDKEYWQRYKENMTEEQKERRKLQRRQRTLNMTEEQKEAKRVYMRKHRANMTDEEREKVRQRWCSGDESVEHELERFDEELRKRQGSSDSTGFPAHREHGWYLPNDD